MFKLEAEIFNIQVLYKKKAFREPENVKKLSNSPNIVGPNLTITENEKNDKLGRV